MLATVRQPVSVSSRPDSYRELSGRDALFVLGNRTAVSKAFPLAVPVGMNALL